MSIENSLYNAILNNNLTKVVKLLKKVKDNKIMNYLHQSHLHISVMNPTIAQLLLEKGADVNEVNNRGDTPLHSAVDLAELETVCMLLYYNADPNIANREKVTPFMKALMNGSQEVQEVLLEYVYDFDQDDGEYNILALALKYNSPFAEEIILRGGRVDHTAIENFNFSDENLDLFKFIWQRIPDSEFDNDTVGPDLLYRLSQGTTSRNFGSYLDFIVNNSSEHAIQGMASGLCLVPLRHFYSKCYHFGCLEQLTKFISLLLPYDFHCSPVENINIYELFGHCDLFQILLHFTLDYSYLNSVNCASIVPTYLCLVKTDIRMICNLVKISDFRYPKNLRALITARAFWAHPSVVELLNEVQKRYFPKRDDINLDLPNFPSLLELARDKARRYIISKLSLLDSSRYYTYIQHLDMPRVYKEILTFEKKIYSVNL